MENTFNPVVSDAGKMYPGTLAADAQKLAGDARNEARQVADRGKQAASELGSRARDLIDDVKSSGREFFDRSGELVERGKRRLSDVSSRVGEYADDNTALVMGGALLAGILLGYLLTSRNR